MHCFPSKKRCFFYHIFGRKRVSRKENHILFLSTGPYRERLTFFLKSFPFSKRFWRTNVVLEGHGYGRNGIRTHGMRKCIRWFSKPVPSATQPFFHFHTCMCGTPWRGDNYIHGSFIATISRGPQTSSSMFWRIFICNRAFICLCALLVGGTLDFVAGYHALCVNALGDAREFA